MKKIVKIIVPILLVIVLIVGAILFAFRGITSNKELSDALSTYSDSAYLIRKDIKAKRNTCMPITQSISINGDNHKIISYEEGADSTIFQNEPVNSTLSNIEIVGNAKYDVGMWVGAGSMVMSGCNIHDYKIMSGRLSAMAIGNDAEFIVYDTTFSNKYYDIDLCDTAIVTLNAGVKLDTMRISTNWGTLNLGKGFDDDFSILFDHPIAKTIGTVDESVDLSKISVANDGYFLENNDGALVLKRSSESAITFDMAKREKLYKGSTGFLYGAAEINDPSIALLQGLQPNTMVQKAYNGLQHPTGDAVRTSSALMSAGVKDMQIYLQDNYLEWPYDAPMKDDTIDLDAYEETVKSIVTSMLNDTDEETADMFSYVLFNEPDQIWFGGNLDGLKSAWKRIYDTVHSLNSNARCVGPNCSGFNADDYDSFLGYCKDNDCLPEIISWHELGDISLTDFYEHYDTVQSLVKKYYPANKQPQLMVNEYARHYDIGSPGGLVKWLSMFEDKDMSGCLAYWAMANSFNELAADQNSPTSSWWVYHWYAQMTGQQCPLVAPDFKETRFYGVSSYDKKNNIGYVLFGGSEDENVAETVYLDNINSTDLVNSNAVNVKVYGVKYSGQHGATYKPQVIYNGAVKISDNRLKLVVADTDEMDAFFAVLTKPGDNANASSMTASLSTLSYEAEDAKLLGGATAYNKIGWATFATSGRMDVGSINNNGDGVEFTVNVPKSAKYTASLYYSLQAPFVDPKTLEPREDGQNRAIGKTLPYGVKVDGKDMPNILLESTVTWAYKNHCDITLDLTAGEHTITFTQINGDEGEKGNLQLVAALDKLDLNITDNNDFTIDLAEMQSFKSVNGYRLTVVASKTGYYEVSADKPFKILKQCIDYAKDAKSTSTVSTYFAEVGNVVYLSKGANTLEITTESSTLSFKFVDDNADIIKSTDAKLVGAKLVDNTYAASKKVIDSITGDAYAEFTVNADSNGIYNIGIRYSNDEPAPVMQKADGSTYIHPYNIDLVERFAQIKVNDNEAETVYFRNTLSWDTFKTVDVEVPLKQGRNTIRIYNDNSYHFSSLVDSSAPVIDTLTIAKISK